MVGLEDSAHPTNQSFRKAGISGARATPAVASTATTNPAADTAASSSASRATAPTPPRARFGSTDATAASTPTPSPISEHQQRLGQDQRLERPVL